MLFFLIFFTKLVYVLRYGGNTTKDKQDLLSSFTFFFIAQEYF